MKKKIKIVGIILLVIFLISTFIIGIKTFYKYNKLQTILNKVEYNITHNNYYIKTTTINKDEKNTTETFYKDGIGKFVADNGVYTWFKGNEAYMINENEKTAYQMNSEKSNILVTKDTIGYLYPCYSESDYERFIFAGNLNNIIKKVKIDDEEYIYIRTEDEHCIRSYWIIEKWSELAKAKMEFPNGEVYDYEYDIKYTATTIKQTELPSFEGYTLKDAEGNVVESFEKEQEVLTEQDPKIENEIVMNNDSTEG